MIVEHKDERKYATWKLEGRFYELSFTAEDGKIQRTWLALKKHARGSESFSEPNSLGSITVDELDDLSEIVQKAQAIIEKEGLNILQDHNEDQIIAEEVTEALSPV